MREVKLPSGAVLKVNAAPFKDAKALYQAVLKELKEVPVTSKTELGSLYKDFFCVGLSSPIIESCLWECFKRCLINDMKIDDQTFEPVERRDDYMMVCLEVAKENVFPFGKSLYAEYETVMKMMVENPI